MLVAGENGAGKTNLLEALHLGTQGFSPRTRAESSLIRFGAARASVGLAVVRAGVPHRVRVRLSTGAAKVAELDGARLASAELLRRELPALVFTPDRLAVVKAGPAARRAYIRLTYADAPENLYLGFQDDVLNDVTTGEGRPFPVLYPVAPLAEGGYAAWDGIRQRAIRFRIVTPQGGVARLMLTTPNGEVAAKRVR